MKNYADYDFYENQYKGSISIDLFDSLIVKASRDIDRNINRELTDKVINELSDNDKWKLKYVACELVDFIDETETGSATSISLDGVSISQLSSTEIKQNKRKIYDNLPLLLTRYL